MCDRTFRFLQRLSNIVIISVRNTSCVSWRWLLHNATRTVIKILHKRSFSTANGLFASSFQSDRKHSSFLTIEPTPPSLPPPEAPCTPSFPRHTRVYHTTLVPSTHAITNPTRSNTSDAYIQQITCPSRATMQQPCLAYLLRKQTRSTPTNNHRQPPGGGAGACFDFFHSKRAATKTNNTKANHQKQLRAQQILYRTVAPPHQQRSTQPSRVNESLISKSSATRTSGFRTVSTPRSASYMKSSDASVFDEGVSTPVASVTDAGLLVTPAITTRSILYHRMYGHGEQKTKRARAF